MSIDLMDELFGENATYDANAADQAAKFAGKIPPGKYTAFLEGVQVKEVGEGTVHELEFKIQGGACNGLKVRYSLFLSVKETDKDGNPKTAEQIAEQKARIKNEFWHTAGVLGLAVKVTKDGKSEYKLAPGKRDFKDVRGAVAQIETRIRKYRDAKTGEDKETSEIKMFGIQSLPAGSSVPTVGSSSNAAPATRAADLSDLI